MGGLPSLQSLKPAPRLHRTLSCAQGVQLLAPIILRVWKGERLEEKGDKLISLIMQLPHSVARLFPHEQFVFI